MSLKKNILGRVYQHGIGLSVDLRSLIIQELIENGSNCVTGKVSRGVFSRVAKKFKVRVKTVRKVWKRFLQEGTYTPQMRLKKGRLNLTEPDKELIKLLKRETSSISGKELQDKFKKYSPVSGDVSVSTGNRSISRDLNFTYKRIKRPYSERFTHVNMLYSQAYIDFCQTKRTHQIKFIDKSGFQLSCT